LAVVVALVEYRNLASSSFGKRLLHDRFDALQDVVR
jgi:hypothetical protein